MCAARFLCGLEFLRGPLQCREVTPAEQGQQQLELLPWPVPPPEPLQTVDGLRCEPLPDGLRRYAAYDGVGLHVPVTTARAATMAPSPIRTPERMTAS